MIWSTACGALGLADDHHALGLVATVELEGRRDRDLDEVVLGVAEQGALGLEEADDAEGVAVDREDPAEHPLAADAELVQHLVAHDHHVGAGVHLAGVEVAAAVDEEVAHDPEVGGRADDLRPMDVGS